MKVVPTLQLQSPVQFLPGVGPKRAQDLSQVGINTIEDLLYFLPFRYIDAQEVTPLANLEENQITTVKVEILSHQPLKTRKGRQFIVTKVADDSGSMTVSFFHQPYVLQTLQQGQVYTMTGKVTRYRGQLTLTNPSYEPANRDSIHTGRIIPVYSQTSDLSMRLVRKLLYIALQKVNIRLPEYLSPEVRKKAQLMPREEASLKVHFPDNLQEARQARQRLAFDELWNLFAHLDEQGKKLRKESAVWSSSASIEQSIKLFKKISPFTLTTSQVNACQSVARQLQQPHPTQHIIQGEVGSGKTMVATFALLAAALENQQALLLAPTTILAQQHFAMIKPLAAKAGVECHLWISDQKSPLPSSGGIAIGTHALLHSSEKFNPGVIVVDEEHRFGVQQREQYWHKTPRPHLISMTATPIPRTLAHIMFTNQSVSFLDLIPGKEKNITTRVVPSSKLESHLHWLNEQIKDGRQAFLLAPLIQPSEAEGFENIMDAQSLFKLATKYIPQSKVALLTGQDKSAKKDQTLNKLRQGKISVLVATPVIEVGIDIPAASIMTITSAERFGLAQLHQLRGRVGRQGQDSWCFLMPSHSSSNTARLKQMEHTKEGWKLAELDLKKRGVGEFLGTRQSGWDTLEIASWLDLDLLKKTKQIYEQFGSSSTFHSNAKT